MADFKKALSYPFQDNDWPIKIFIGSLYSILPIVNFFSIGYSYKIFKQTLNGGEPYLPEWEEEDFGDHFFQGFKIFVIMMCYFIIPTVLSWTGLIFILIGVLGVPLQIIEQSEIVAYLLGALFLSLGFITGIPPSLLWPMALANYAKNNENIWAAFKLWEIIPKISIVFKDYIVAVLLMALVRILVAIISGVCNSVIPFAGTLLKILLSFYIDYLVFDALFGAICSKAYPDDSARIHPSPES